MRIVHIDNRFSAKTEHGEAELLYEVDGNKMRIYHTFVPAKDRGKEMAKRLMDVAVVFAKKKSLDIDPQCPYALHYMKKYMVDKPPANAKSR